MSAPNLAGLAAKSAELRDAMLAGPCAPSPDSDTLLGYLIDLNELVGEVIQATRSIVAAQERAA